MNYLTVSFLFLNSNTCELIHFVKLHLLYNLTAFSLGWDLLNVNKMGFILCFRLWERLRKGPITKLHPSFFSRDATWPAELLQRTVSIFTAPCFFISFLSDPLRSPLGQLWRYELIASWIACWEECSVFLLCFQWRSVNFFIFYR